ncbi:MAG: hypothetical protein OXI58_14010 [Gemmatimonadota bacterium]|nr:hypothetical protein [Gemmatimonadota bacterium]
MSMRQSHTAVVERNQCWEGDFVTEPYEAGWSHEAIFFVRLLRAEAANSSSLIAVELQVQISPDGIHWCDEGSRLNFVAQHVIDKPSFVQVSHYGGWLRLAGTAKNGCVWALVHLALKA